MRTKPKSKYVQRYFVFQKSILTASAPFKADRPGVIQNTADQLPTLVGRLGLGAYEHQVVKDWAKRAKNGSVLFLDTAMVVCFTKPPVVERMFVEEAVLRKPGTETIPWGTKLGAKAKGKKRYAERQ